MSSRSKSPETGFAADIAELYRRSRLLLDAGLPDLVANADEDAAIFSYRSPPLAPAQVDGRLRALEPLAAIGSVGIDCRIAEGLEGSLILRPGGRLDTGETPFELNEILLDDPPSDPAAAALLEDLREKLERQHAELSLDDWSRGLETLEAAGVALELRLKVSISKDGWLTDVLGRDLAARPLLFLLPQELLQHLESSTAELVDAWLAPDERPLIVLLPAAEGSLEGSWLGVFGGDAAAKAAGFVRERTGPAAERERQRLEKIRDNLADKECRWKEVPKLTPAHLRLADHGFSGEVADDVRRELATIAAELAVGYLADRTDAKEGEASRSLFYGYKTVQVPSGREALRRRVRDEGLDPEPLLDLWAAAYQDLSAERLKIVRWLVTQKLEEGPEGNERALLDGADEILSSARDQFDGLLRRNLAEYFQARQKLLDFLRGYTQEIADAVTELSGELISNLYKTLGAILGAVVAAELTNEAALVVGTTALLYFIYVVSTLRFPVRAIHERYRLKKKEYDNHVAQLVARDVLMKEEIERFQGQAFEDAEAMFHRYFEKTRLVYRWLAGLSLLVAAASLGILLLP